MKWFNKTKKSMQSNNKRPSLMHWIKGSLQHKTLNYADDDVSEKQIKQNEDPNARLLEIKAKSLKKGLRFPANYLTTGSELNWYSQMGVKPKDIQKNSTWLFIGMIAVFVVTALVGISDIRIWALGLVLAGLVWAMNYLVVRSKYNVYSFNNELLFGNFLMVLDLSQLKDGYSINALLARAARRFKNRILKTAIETLNLKIADHPKSSKPYIEFANKFSSTPRAKLFMLSVYSMAQGNHDDSEIASLKRSVARDLSKQSKKLRHQKISRFGKLQNFEFIEFILWILAYLLFMVGMLVFKMAKGI